MGEESSRLAMAGVRRGEGSRWGHYGFRGRCGGCDIDKHGAVRRRPHREDRIRALSWLALWIVFVAFVVFCCWKAIPEGNSLVLIGNGTYEVRLPVEPNKITLTNTSDYHVRFRLSTETAPDLSSMSRIESYCHGTNPHQTAANMANLFKERLDPAFTPGRDVEGSYDPVKLLNCYGSGLCHELAIALSRELKYCGMASGIQYMGNHVITAILDGDTTRVLDPDYGYAPMIAGKLSTPEQFVSYVRSRGDDYINQSVFVGVSWTPDFTTDTQIVYSLSPGETCTRYRRSSLGYFGPHPPSECANAVFEISGKRLSSLSAEFPFPVTGGQIRFYGRGRCMVGETTRTIDAQQISLLPEVPPMYKMHILPLDGALIEGYKVVTRCSSRMFPGAVAGRASKVYFEYDRSEPGTIKLRYD